MRMMMRQPIALLTALLAAPALAGPMRYAEDRAPAIINPLFTTTMSEARLDELVFEGLFADSRDLRSEARLASSWKIAEDRRSMEITLREGVTWHDGHPFTAGDVAFTIEAMRNPTTASSEASRVSWILSVEVLDDRHVRLRFETPQARPEDMLQFKILPAHLFVTTAVSRSHPFRTRPIGTGPYMVVGRGDDNSVVLQRNLAYYRDVGIGEITMREVADKAYQSKLLLYGSLEVLTRVLPRDLAELEHARSVDLYPYQTHSWWYLGLDLTDSRWTDPRAREAFASMIDVESLLGPIGTGSRVSGPFVPSSPYYDHDVALREQDSDRAAALLSQAGYRRDPRGRWTKDGEPLVIHVATLANLDVAQDVLIQLESQLLAHGVGMEAEFLGGAEWKRQIWAEHDFDVILSQWTFDRNEDVYEQFHSHGSRNFSGYASAEVDDLLDRAHASGDPQEKRALLRAVHTRVAEDLPMVFLWTLDNYAAVSHELHRVAIHPFYFFTWVDDWSMDP